MAEGIRSSLTQVAQWLGARLQGDDVVFHGVSTDSRQLEPGMLFVALQGPNHDGHDHVTAAQAAGAVAAVVARPLPIDIPQLVVDDTLLALGEMAAAWRQTLGTPLVAITGSNGKTTVKEMCAAIFSQVGPTLATNGNLNNNIGVPLTLLRLSAEHRYGVIEMGANHAGEIAYLTRMVAPQVALITNAGSAHLEGFGSLEGVASAKGEIYGGLAEDGVAIINADDRFAPLWHELTEGRRVITFGADADVSATYQVDEKGQLLLWRGLDHECAFTLPLLGEHNLRNALAASAAALALELDSSVIAKGLQGMKPVQGRLYLRSGLENATIIDDSYNANPASLIAGLKVLAGFSGKRYLALGDMGELGEGAQAMHREMGEQALQLGIDRLYAYGALSRAACEGFGSEGRHFSEQQQLIDALRPNLHADVTVLVKGSRSSHMDRVADALCERGQD